MASLWLALWVVLSSLLTGSGSELSNLRFLIQDGIHGVEEEATADSLGPTQRRWEWKASGDEGHQIYPLGARRKRAIATKEPPKKRPPVAKATAGPSTLLTKMAIGKKAGPPSLHKKVAQVTVTTVSPTMGTPLTTPKNSAPSWAPGLPKPGKVPAEAKRPKDGHHFVPKGGAVAPQGTSETGRIGKETTTVAFPGMGNVSRTTEHWPWLHDQTSAISQTLVATTEVSTAILKHGLATAGPRGKSKGKLWWTTQTSVDNSDVSTAPLKHGSTTARPNVKAKDVFNPKTATASSSTLWPWLDDMSTSQTLVDISDASPATETPAFDTVRPSLKTKRKDRFFPVTTVASPTAAATAPVKPPVAPATIVGKCLVALLLLALVAAIFIVITGVLAAMLWRQKQAYKMNRHHHTEMVCISSLLATEEAEEARGRPPREKRLKMRRENGSETEMDNLTLNSFLPDH